MGGPRPHRHDPFEHARHLGRGQPEIAVPPLPVRQQQPRLDQPGGALDHLGLGALALLDEALDALEQTAAAREWFGPVYLEAYLRAKRAEAANTKDIDPVVLCARYAEAY